MYTPCSGSTLNTRDKEPNHAAAAVACELPLRPAIKERREKREERREKRKERREKREEITKKAARDPQID